MTDQREAIAGVFDRAAETYDQVGVEFFAAVGRQLVSDARLSPTRFCRPWSCTSCPHR